MYERLPLDFIGVTDNFGARIDPITKVSSYHYGVDLGWHKYQGEKVYAIYDSTLVEEGYDKNLGNYTVFKESKTIAFPTQVYWNIYKKTPHGKEFME